MNWRKKIMETAKIRNGKIMRHCHMCKSRNISLVLDLGWHPPSDSFLKDLEEIKSELFFPLRLFTCEDCGLLQIDARVDPKVLYQRNYIYESSTTKTGRSHFEQMAKDICECFSIPKGSLAVDIGSNVGVLLQGFKNAGLNVLGVDPAKIPAKKAIKSGIETIIDFFDRNLAEDIVNRYGKASVITGTNVFAHLHELDDAVKSMKYLLAEDGVIAIEAPYAMDLVENTEYDTIYLEHIGYLSVKPMRRYFKKFDLELFDIKKISIHGGSLRYYVGYKGRHPVSEKIAEYIAKEEEYGLYSKEKLFQFADKVKEQKESLRKLLQDLKADGKKIVGLSAPAKGNTLLNYCQINRDFLDFITEKNPLKIGRYTPGTHIPIYNDEKILTENPDYALILAWNFADEIMNNMKEFKEKGGKFIIPIPKPKII